ncbi:hypothetical protein BBP40_008827, partial [Aspergillus hancockii]
MTAIVTVPKMDSPTIKPQPDYRVWAMKSGEAPNQPYTHPIAESPSVEAVAPPQFVIRVTNQI